MPAKKKQNKKIAEATLREKLHYIQTNLKVPKSQYNKFGNYSYRNCEDILQAVKSLLDETKSVLILSDTIISIDDRYYVRALAEFMDCNEDEKAITVTAFARETENRKGMDTAQITGSTSSYARKYALNGLFGIDDEKDPDIMNNRDEKSKPKPDKKTGNSLQKSKVDNSTPSVVTPSSKTTTPPNPAKTKVLNYLIEKLAEKVESGNIVDIDKLKDVILKKYGQLPTKLKSGNVVLKYVEEELGIENISTENEFIKGLE